METSANKKKVSRSMTSERDEVKWSESKGGEKEWQRRQVDKRKESRKTRLVRVA